MGRLSSVNQLEKTTLNKTNHENINHKQQDKRLFFARLKKQRSTMV